MYVAVVPNSRLLLPAGEFGEYITVMPPTPVTSSGVHVITVGWKYKLYIIIIKEATTPLYVSKSYMFFLTRIFYYTMRYEFQIMIDTNIR